MFIKFDPTLRVVKIRMSYTRQSILSGQHQKTFKSDPGLPARQGIDVAGLADVTLYIGPEDDPDFYRKFEIHQDCHEPR
ncbi:MAG TPA: hypothetical protein DEF72_03005 [Gammaproteobacteria bacterium]|mgnify:FL=1|nr:hypothetical protein [Gammaproteobacteria bacterium]HBX26382.1 hypothetical protein [Gammaproteobacteria bacterium]